MSATTPLGAVEGIDLGRGQFHTTDHRSRQQSGNASASPDASAPPNSTVGSESTAQPSTYQSPLQPHTAASTSLINETPNPVITSPTRRGSWLSNISSKFASHSHGNNEGVTPAVSASESPPRNHPGFLIATLRRLSASSVPGRGSFARNQGNGVKCERVVMNKNHTRDRCQISELEGVRLKKVAFCVDVEVSVPPPLPKDDGKPPQYMTSGVSVIQQTEKVVSNESGKSYGNEQSSNACDGEAPCVELEMLQTANSEDMQNGCETGKGDTPGKETASPVQTTDSSCDTPLPSQPFPAPAHVNHHSQGLVPVAKPDDKTSRSRRRPTTDAARIYKRCCQLRETSMLPIIAEQLIISAGKTYLDSLDLSNHTLNVSDALVLSDFLALAPVTKLDLENCGLTDESLRVILSGLLAVKQPNLKGKPSRRDASLKGTGVGHTGQGKSSSKSRGMVEWLSLRNNPKIGRDGWRYISLFLHMSRSLKALDVSMIPLPRNSVHVKTSIHSADTTALFCKALSERLVGFGLQELAMNRCDLSTEQLRLIVEAIRKGGTKRLDLEENNVTDDGLIYLAQWIKEGDCEGISLSSNDLQEHIDILAASLHANSPLQALGLANCNLNAGSLSTLLPALTILSNFRLLDLSHNPLLFSTQPDALPLLRKYLPRLPMLKKLQLAHTYMTPDHAIALSEILPEIKSLAYFNALDNPLLVPGTANADPTDVMNREGSLEEGAALYTALVAAVKVSKTIVRMDIDDPGMDSGEVIKGLARKMVAFCLRNMENAEVYNDKSLAAAGEELDETDDEYSYAGDGEEDDLVVGGTGVVKALGVCLGNKSHVSTVRRSSGFDSPTDGKAYEMSKALLCRARKIRMRIQPALQQAARGEMDEIHYRKLLFLDDTLYHVITRFEEEYPDCRLLPSSGMSPPPPSRFLTIPGTCKKPVPLTPFSELPLPNHLSSDYIDDFDHDETHIKTPALSRQPSDVSLYSRRALDAEEGRMHKLATFVQKQILEKQLCSSPSKDESEDTPESGSLNSPVKSCGIESEHIQEIQMLMEGMDGEHIRQKVAEEGGAVGLIKKLEDVLNKDVAEVG